MIPNGHATFIPTRQRKKLDADTSPPPTWETEAAVTAQIIEEAHNPMPPHVKKVFDHPPLYLTDKRLIGLVNMVRKRLQDGKPVDSVVMAKQLDFVDFFDGDRSWYSRLYSFATSPALAEMEAERLVTESNRRDILSIVQQINSNLNDYGMVRSGVNLLHRFFEQIDSDVVPKSPLPPIEPPEFYQPQPDPPEVMKGLLYAGCKMVIGSASKSRKSFLALDLAICVSLGLPWMGFPTCRGRVLYINLELQKFTIRKRIRAIAAHYGKTVGDVLQHFDLLNMRGHPSSLAVLSDGFRINRWRYDLIVIDPIYKTYSADQKENDAGDMAQLLNELDRITHQTGSAVVFVTHFSKGNQSEKEAIDRISGSGVFARDPDSIMVMTQHAEVNCLSVHCVTRDFPDPEKFAIRWAYPMYTVDPDLDPDDLKQPKGRKKEEAAPFTTPTIHDYLTIFPEFDPTADPGDLVIHHQVEKLAFKQKRWLRDSIVVVREKAIRQRKVKTYRRSRSEPLFIGIPACVEAFEKSQSVPVQDDMLP